MLTNLAWTQLNGCKSIHVYNPTKQKFNMQTQQELHKWMHTVVMKKRAISFHCFPTIENSMQMKSLFIIRTVVRTFDLIFPHFVYRSFLLLKFPKRIFLFTQFQLLSLQFVFKTKPFNITINTYVSSLKLSRYSLQYTWQKTTS